MTEPTLEGDEVALRPTEPGDADALRAILGAPEVAIRWGPQGEDFPFDDDTLTRLTVLHDGGVIGLMQFYEEPDPDARSADIDIFLAPERHDRGLGTDAVRALSRHLLEERGHHRLTLTTATDNHRAIRAYEKAGFRRVGVLEASAWSHAAGGWRDELLMELVERPAPAVDRQRRVTRAALARLTARSRDAVPQPDEESMRWKSPPDRLPPRRPLPPADRRPRQQRVAGPGARLGR